MLLFNQDLVDPAKLGPSDGTEPEFHYLQSSGRPEFFRIRELLEEWFASYPEEHKSELKQRFVKSKSDIHSPAFELALHATFMRHGADVQIHPKVSDETEKRPDFLIRLPSGFEFYLEAVLARGQSDDERKREQVVQTLYATINRRLDSPEYFWSVMILKQGSAAPNGKQITHALAQYMARLNRDEVGTQLEAHGFFTPEKLLWENAGWSIEFLPIPKNVEAIGKPDPRPLGVFPMPRAVWCSDKIDIRESIKFKVKHHRAVEKPYLIAVNAMNWSASERDFIDAIYGSEQITMTRFEDGNHSFERGRMLDGIWREEDGVKNQNLFAVIGAVCLQPHSVAGCLLTVYENPYIEIPAQARVKGFPRFEATDGHLVQTPGQTLGKLFGLPECWPREESPGEVNS